MNPFLEVKERLSDLAVAGTQLLGEDFRLKKTVQTFAVLAEKNPMCKKVHDGLAQLLSAEQERQGELLLSLLGLVDAVLYTQAEYAVEGELEALPENPGDGEILSIAYSQISPLLKALTTSGGGRYETVQTALLNHPEWFADYRLLHALILDLGDSYGEMAELVYQSLLGLITGEKVELSCYFPDANGYVPKEVQLPRLDQRELTRQLRQGFDPKGKRDMARRVQLISAAAREEENDWYLDLVENGTGEVRLAAIEALKYSDENGPCLIQLARGKGGKKAKETARQVLGTFDTAESNAFWAEELPGHPELCEYVTESTSDAISDLVAKVLSFHTPQFKAIHAFPAVLFGKTSEAMLTLYRQMLEYRRVVNRSEMQGYLQTLSDMDEQLMLTLVDTQSPAVFAKVQDFLAKLPDQQQKLLPQSCFAVDALTLTAGELYERWSKPGILDTFSNDWKRQFKLLLEKCFSQMDFSEGCHRFHILRRDRWITRPLREPLDPRWTQIFFKRERDSLVEQLTDFSRPELREQAAAYCIERIRGTRHYRQQVEVVNCCLRILEHCQWKDYSGLLISSCDHIEPKAYYQWMGMFDQFRRCAGLEATWQEAKGVMERYEQLYGASRQAQGRYLDSLKSYLAARGYLDEI